MSSLFRSCLIHCASAAVAVLAIISSSEADDFRLIPAFAVKQEYNDNIFFQSNQATNSFITTLSPGILLEERTEKLEAGLSARLDLLQYSAESRLNSVDQSYTGSLRYRVSQLFSGAMKAGFDHGSRPDRLVETTGAVINQESDRQQYSANGEYSFTEKLAGSLSLGYDKTAYRNNDAADVAAYSVSGGAIYDLGEIFPLTKLQANSAYSRSRYEAATIESYGATIGMTRSIDELWSLSLNVGGRYTLSSFSVFESTPAGFIPAEISNATVGWLANLSLIYKDDMMSGNVNFGHNVSNTSGRAGSTELTSIVGQVSRRFSAELNGTLGIGYYLNRSGQNEFAARAVDETTYRANPGMSYEFSKNVVLDVSYEYARLQDDQAGTESARNKFFVLLNVRRPIFE